MGEGMGFPGTDADTGATAARGCNALLMNTKNFIKDCLYIKLSTKLCPITPVAPFHAWKLLAAGPRLGTAFSIYRFCTILSAPFLDRIQFSSSTFRSRSSPIRCRGCDVDESIEKCHGRTRDRRSIRLGRVNYFATFKTCIRVYRVRTCIRVYR